MWEIIDTIEFTNGRTNAVDIWRGRDAEGREIFSATAQRDGCHQEPTGTEIFYSVDECRKLIAY